ncbi:MAG TPA: tRNA 2-thiouridine(34) synthase MnmA [Candidatus Eisenbacteria bacterium]|nr:tRNA 2-thiouridine(34) synthase MnmA [Candidatus Eisenbacteria bacterium]
MKTAVLLSGGVDSSVALHLAKMQGAEVTAFYLKIWLEEELAFLGDCPWEDDLKYARAVCDQAKVPLEVVPLQTEYQERVVSHVLSELKQGRTPSPDILCNQWIKFGLFFDKIDPTFAKVVSGHYAQVEQRDGKFLLKRSPDAVKDQTYFLSRLSQQQLSRLWFPIGHLTKKQVRQMARKLDLPNRERKDSQGICFLGKIKYPEFVRYHLGERKGEIIDTDSGKVLGEQKGVWFHTVGQRKGLRLPGGPWYVVNKDLPANKLFVAHADRYLEHARNEFIVADVHWISGEPAGHDLQTKVRHSPHLENCRIAPLGERRWSVHLENKDQGIASGQSAIFYEGDICLGVGVIE